MVAFRLWNNLALYHFLNKVFLDDQTTICRYLSLNDYHTIGSRASSTATLLFDDPQLVEYYTKIV